MRRVKAFGGRSRISVHPADTRRAPSRHPRRPLDLGDRPAVDLIREATRSVSRKAESSSVMMRPLRVSRIGSAIGKAKFGSSSMAVDWPCNSSTSMVLNRATSSQGALPPRAAAIGLMIGGRWSTAVILKRPRHPPFGEGHAACPHSKPSSACLLEKMFDYPAGACLMRATRAGKGESPAAGP